MIAASSTVAASSLLKSPSQPTHTHHRTSSISVASPLQAFADSESDLDTLIPQSSRLFELQVHKLHHNGTWQSRTLIANTEWLYVLINTKPPLEKVGTCLMTNIILLSEKSQENLRLSKGWLYFLPTEHIDDVDMNAATRSYDADKVKVKMEREDGGKGLLLSCAGDTLRIEFNSFEEALDWSEALEQHGAYRSKEKQSISDRIPWKEMKDVSLLGDVGVKPQHHATSLNFANVAFARSFSAEGDASGRD